MVKEKHKKESAPEKRQEKEIEETLVRILNRDIPGSRNVYSGLARIKGVSWAISNVVCVKLKIERTKKISELSADEIKNSPLKSGQYAILSISENPIMGYRRLLKS